MTLPIATVPVAESDRATATIVGAFLTDPFTRYFYDDVHSHLNYMPRMVHAMAAKAFENGTAWHTAAFGGVAIWLEPGVGADEEALEKIFAEALPDQRLQELSSIPEQMIAAHPDDAWYLPFMGVDPTRQGNGYGSALLAHTLALFDEKQQAAYLESTNPRNNPLYERHGFEVMGVFQAGNSPPMWPMLRKPR